MFALGFLACWRGHRQAPARARHSRSTGPTRWSSPRSSAASIGARLCWIVENCDEAKDDLSATCSRGTGLVWYGGALGGAIAVLLWAWWRGFLGADAARHRPRSRSRSATRSGGSAASSPATATTARRGTGRGRWRYPARHRADGTDDGPPDADLRDARDGAGRVVAVAAARRLRPGRAVRALPRARRGSSASSSSSCAATTTWSLGLTLPQLQSLAMIAAGSSGSRRRGAMARCCYRLARARRPPRPAASLDEAHAQVLQLGVVLHRAVVAAGHRRRSAAAGARSRESSRERSTGTRSSPSACRSSSGQLSSATALERRASASRNASSAAPSAAEVEAPRAQAARRPLAASRADRDDRRARRPLAPPTSAR